MEKFDENDINYQQAKKQVEKLRGFYGHLFSYVAVNLLFAYFNYINLKSNESYFQVKNFLTAIFWGIGLLAHALFVFLPRFNFAKQWEEKKIKELMDKNK